MKQSRPMKKKKKERTWAEAATVVLKQNGGGALGIREIQQKIFQYKLKDIKMNKQAENVLKTMLSHHANMENCPFYKVKERSGYYALKKDMPRYVQEALTAENMDLSTDDIDEDSNGSGSSTKRSTRGKATTANDIVPSHSTSPSGDSKIQGNSNNATEPKKKTITNKTLAVSRRSNSYTGSALAKSRLLTRRRTSSPNIIPSNLRNQASIRQVHRSRSSNYVPRSSHLASNGNKPRTLPVLDLETPGSVLTNTRIKSVINSATFSMLPASYQYQLVQLLPKVDREVDKNGVPRIAPTALNNEFFSQALQDWVTQLSEGEFTRETQARIMQEIAKERGKISAWKEKFFEEYYGQKTEVKRNRSRSHDATSNLADLSFEAQVAKFQHLRDALQKDLVSAEDEDANVDVVSDSGSEHDPDYTMRTENFRSVVSKRFLPVPECTKEPNKDLVAKPTNRRKINKPFKRPIYNSMKDHTQNTALMHHKTIMQHRNIPLYRDFNPIVASRPSFQIRDEFYHSDSDVSDTGELSDSNSFHQHDDTDEEAESSDGMMNMGDDNLMDGGEDSESDEYEGIQNGLQSNSVTAEHSYTRLPNLKRRRQSSDEREWRRARHNMTSVMPVLAKDDMRIAQPNPTTTLVLRPRGNLGQTVQAMNYSEDSSSTSPEQPYKKSCLTQPIFGKILTVAKAETSKEERVGVLFGRGMQPNPCAYHGDSIIPRITTSSLLTSSEAPTTVCTSYGSVRVGTPGLKTGAERDPSYLFYTTSGSDSTPDSKSDPTNNPSSSFAAYRNNVVFQNTNNSGNVACVPQMHVGNPGSGEKSSELEVKHLRNNMGPFPRNTGQPKNAHVEVQDSKSPAVECDIGTRSAITVLSKFDEDSLSPDQKFGGTEPASSAELGVLSSPLKDDVTSVASKSALDTGILQTLWPKIDVAARNDSKFEQKRDVCQDTSSVSMTGVRHSSSSLSPCKTVEKQTPKAANNPVMPVANAGKKIVQPAISSNPVKRTRTLAEIKAQMKAKRLAAATASPTNSSAKQVQHPQTTASGSPILSAQSNLPRNSPKKVLPRQSSQSTVDEPSVKGSDPVDNDTDRVESNDPSSGSVLTDSTAKVLPQGQLLPLKQDGSSAEASPKAPGKIILKIKAAEGKKYSVKVNTRNTSPVKSSGTESDDDVIVRKTRRLSHMISSSGDSSDDIVACDDAMTSNASATTSSVTAENYSMLSQLSLPSTYTGKVVSVMDHHLPFKKTQKSPVFGEPAFEGLSSMPKKGMSLSTRLPTENFHPDAVQESIAQPFMSNKPVIGFQDIPSCTALSSSNAPTFIPPSSIIPPAQDAQKYRSTSKGKSLVQMQELARSNQIQSDESEVATDTEDEENGSTTSSAEDSSHSTFRKTRRKKGDDVSTKNNLHHNDEEEVGSECEGSYSSSSNDEHAIVTDCICACKRLVLCKGCGAYTHEECLSSSSLCSLCV